MNRLYVGFSKEIELPPDGFLLIDDEVRDIPRSKVFDPLKNSLNPLRGITYKRARDIADIVYTVYGQGENTLTVRNGKRALFQEIFKENTWKEKRATRFDRIKGDEEVRSTVRDLLMSPVLKSVLCGGKIFNFNPKTVIQARINRAELGDFDALVLGLFLMSHYRGQLVIPSLDFYGRDMHIGLIRERRLIAGCNFLGELPVKLRQSVLLMEEKLGSRARLEDAQLLAEYAGLVAGTVGFNDFVQGAIA